MELKANELRIGNWIRTTTDEQVCDVLCDCINTHEHECLLYDMIAPITLTEEWLVRFGFKKSGKYGYFLSPHKDSCSDSCFTRLCFFLEEMDFIVNSNDYEDGMFIANTFINSKTYTLL